MDVKPQQSFTALRSSVSAPAVPPRGCRGRRREKHSSGGRAVKATLADCDKHRPRDRQFNPWDKLPTQVLCCVTTRAINKACVVVWPTGALLQCLCVDLENPVALQYNGKVVLLPASTVRTGTRCWSRLVHAPLITGSMSSALGP